MHRMINFNRNHIVTITTIVYTAACIVAISSMVAGQCLCAHRMPILQELYAATNGSLWSRPWDMSQTDAPCGFEGVTCGSTGDITALSISGRGLRGTLPAALGGLVALEFFSASSNSLSSTLPAALSLCSKMTTFNVSSNALRGSIPESFTNWTLVQSFDVSYNTLTGTLPTQLRVWAQLSRFLIAYNSFVGTLAPEFSSWTSMVWFNAANNNLTGTLPVSYSSWTSMKEFSVENNQLSGSLPSAYAQWTGITVFGVSGNTQISSTLPGEYSAWVSIKRFSGANARLQGTLPIEYSAWTNTTVFSLNSNQLTGTIPPQYASWGSLESFDISSNQLTGTMPASLGQWSRMTLFLVRNNGLTGTIPLEYASWSSLVYFYVASNQLTGAMPAELRVWTRLNQFVVHNNSLTGTLPTSYSRWSGVAFISLHTNQLEGTIPAEWPSSMWNLSDFRVANNSFTGAIPAAFGKLPFLNVFSISSNAFSGMLPDFSSTSLILVDIQHNVQLDATLPAKFQAWTTCHTRIPCTDPPLPLQYCMPPNYDLLADAANIFATIAPYTHHCTNAPQLPVPFVSMTQTFLDDDNPTKPPPSVFASYQSHLAPSAAFTVALSIADPVTGVGLAALGLGRCAPASLREATWYSQVLLSPFYRLGPGVSVLGNVALCIACYASHRVAVQAMMKRKLGPAYSREKQQQEPPSLKTEVEALLRFPQYSLVATLLFARGIAFNGGQSFFIDDEKSTKSYHHEDVIALRIVSGIASMLFLLGLVIFIVWVERQGQGGLTKPLMFERYRAAALKRTRWVPRWVLPIGRWGPDDARKRLGAFRGPVAGGRERFAMLPAGVGIVGSLIVGAVPGTAGGCIAQATCQCLLLGASAIAIGVLRPMRVPAAGWLLCSAWVLQACINLCIVVGRATDAESAIDATMFLSALHSVVGLLRFVHSAVAALWERRIDPKRDIVGERKTSLSSFNGSFSSEVLSATSRLPSSNMSGITASSKRVASFNVQDLKTRKMTDRSAAPAEESVTDQQEHLEDLEELLRVICVRSRAARELL